MNQLKMKQSIFLPLLLCCVFSGFAQVKLPRLIRDSMILQRDEKIKLWGWASVHEKIQVRFNGKVYTTKADANGNWMLHLPPTKAGGPYRMDITGLNKITLHDILFGDVWFCSGQSNMVHQLNIHDVTYANEIATANYPEIRQFLVPAQTSLSGSQTDITDGYWQPAVGEAVRPFSAVAWFFAKRLHEKYKIPIGIINASVGGTPIEAWISEEGLKAFPGPAATIQKNKDTAYINRFRRTAAAMPKTPADAGLAGTPRWYDTNYIPGGWRRINIPGYWEDQGLKDLNGVVWYRREIDIPAAMAGKAATVFLGRIVDADELYINGQPAGRTTYLYPQRRYRVPASVLKTGKNLFVVRVSNTAGKGGFVPDKPYCIFSGADTVDLKGDWAYKVGAVFSPAAMREPGGIHLPNQPAALYNAMVAPETNYAIKGFCWYQGETNTGEPKQYARLLPALIGDWRNKWQQGSVPFLFVQLPGFMDYNYLPAESNWAELRAAQFKSLSVPNTAMAVAIDLGEWNDIHPDNKKDVGERLALAAMKAAYRENITSSGPLYESAVINENKVTISFTDTGSGLMTPDGEAPSTFEIAAADKKFVWAQAKIDGNKIIVWSDDVPAPRYVRYAWSDNPVNPNLFNRELLPASPFSTVE